MEFGYWYFKARGHAIRILLAYLQMDVVETTFNTPQEWAAKKKDLSESLSCPFPNLPYLLDGDQVITEMPAVANAIVNKANRYEMTGKSQNDKVLYTSMISVCNDLFNVWKKMLGKTKEEVYASWDDTVNKEIKPKLEGFCKILGSKPFLLYYISFADIYLYHIADLFELVCHHTGVKHPFKDHPQLVTLRNSISSIPSIKSFISSPSNERDFIRPEWIKYASH